MGGVRILNLIESILKENIKNQSVIFVFPTQIAADLWADRATLITGVSAVAMERFIAWDDFKGRSIKSQKQDKTAIPSVLRKIFSSIIASENAKSPFLKSIINSDYSQYSESFSSWFNQIIPSLAIWKRYYEKHPESRDNEDLDLLELYNKYDNFLTTHNLFEPAWETPPFKADGNHYFVFFPEILSDFIEYKNILESAPDFITPVYLKSSTDKIFDSQVNVFSNARVELKNIAHFILSQKEKNISFENIAINVPDLDIYGPYISRELDLYEIPHILKFSKPLVSFGAGNFFIQLKNCVSNNFSFNSLKVLLFNNELPWIRPELNEALIVYGQKNNCICSFEYSDEKIDIWLKSFKDNSPSADLIAYYNSLKDFSIKITKSKTFAELREFYFQFRNKFFNMDNCSDKSNLIMSRCISELSELIDIEELFPDCQINSPYDFFVEHISSKSYLEQTSYQGVQILPFKTAACAPFDCHIIIDSAQASTSVIYKPLSFLREDKRKILLGGKNYEDPNVSEEFLKLYAMNSTSIPAYFSCSLKTFSGYSQPSSYLIENDLTSTEEYINNNDFYSLEKKFYLENLSFPNKLPNYAKKGFDFWSKTIPYNAEDANFSINKIEELINKKRYIDGNIRISPTHLKQFFYCNQSWLIKYIIELKPQDNEAELMSPFSFGNLYHKILELYCKELKQKQLPIILVEEKLPSEYEQILFTCVEDAIKTENNSYLAKELLDTTKDTLKEFILKTVYSFSKEFNGYTVYNSEEKYFYKLPDKNILLEGTVDCILQNPSEENSFTLIDFKSSNSSIPSNLYFEDEDNLFDFQMPMYIYILNNQKVPIDISNCCFFNIKDGKPTWIELENFELTITKTLDYINSYSEFINNGITSFISSSDFKTCNSCSYRAVCRKVFNVGKNK